METGLGWRRFLLLQSTIEDIFLLKWVVPVVDPSIFCLNNILAPLVKDYPMFKA